MKNSRPSPARAAWLAVGVAAGLAVVAVPPGADAQRGDRARAQYTMVAGRVQGSTEDVIYVVDGANQEVAAFRWSISARALQSTGFRDIRDDSERGVGGGR